MEQLTCKAVVLTLSELSFIELKSSVICSEDDNFPRSCVITSLTLLKEEGKGGRAFISAVKHALLFMIILSNT